MRIRGGPNLQLTGHSRSRFNAPGVGREWPRWPGAGRQSVTYLVPGGRHGRNVSWGETRCRPALRRRCNTERRREDRQPTPTAQVFAQDRFRLARCLSGRTCVRRQVPETAVLVDDRLRPHRMPSRSPALLGVPTPLVSHGLYCVGGLRVSSAHSACNHRSNGLVSQLRAIGTYPYSGIGTRSPLTCHLRGSWWLCS